MCVVCTGVQTCALPILNGHLEFSHRIRGSTQPVRYLEFDQQGRIWASRAYEGVYRIQLSEDLQEASKIDYFDRTTGFPSDFNINVFRTNNQLVFATGHMIYTYDDLKGAIVPFARLNQGLGNLQHAHRILPAGSNRCWMISNNDIALVTLEDHEVRKRSEARRVGKEGV